MHVRVLSEFANRYHAANATREQAFDPNASYEVYSVIRDPSIGSGFVVLAGESGELFFVEMRHVRVVKDSSVSAMVMAGH